MNRKKDIKSYIRLSFTSKQKILNSDNLLESIKKVYKIITMVNKKIKKDMTIKSIILVWNVSEKFQYDLYYMKHRNLLWEIGILIEAVFLALGGRHG